MSVKILFFKIFQATVALLGERFFENSSPIFQGFGENISPTSGKGCGAFLKSGYPLALLAKFVNGKNGNNLASGIFRNVYTLALLAIM